MTDTISDANAAASTLFLGHNGEWWDFWLIISVIAAALVATAIGVTTAGSIISHKRESAAAEDALTRYKLETGKNIAEANARQKQAELEIQQLRSPRSLNAEKFKTELSGTPPQKFEVLYDATAGDGQLLAIAIFVTLQEIGWSAAQKLPFPLGPRPAPPGLQDIFPSLPWSQQAGGQSWGLSVVTNQPPDLDKQTPGLALMLSLSRSLKGPLSQTSFGRDVSMPDGSVRIIVGPKLP